MSELVTDDVQAPEPPSGSVGLAVVGAALGAGLGAGAWFAIEHFFQYQFGYIAVACGALAGVGAVKLGKTQGFHIGVIAALMGVLGVVAGSYGAFYAGLHGERAREEIRGILQADPGFAAQPAEAQEQAIDVQHQMIVSQVSYIEYVKDDTRSLTYMLVFAGIGLFVGFKVGVGGIGNDGNAD